MEIFLALGWSQNFAAPAAAEYKACATRRDPGSEPQ